MLVYSNKIDQKLFSQPIRKQHFCEVHKLLLCDWPKQEHATIFFEKQKELLKLIKIRFICKTFILCSCDIKLCILIYIHVL